MMTSCHVTRSMSVRAAMARLRTNRAMVLKWVAIGRLEAVAEPGTNLRVVIDSVERVRAELGLSDDDGGK